MWQTTPEKMLRVTFKRRSTPTRLCHTSSSGVFRAEEGWTVTVLLSERRERLRRWRAKLPLWGTDSSSHSSVFKSHFWLCSKADFQTEWRLLSAILRLSLCVCVCYVFAALTFSSIPPLMTGSGSGPVGMRTTRESVTDSTKYASFCLLPQSNVMSWYLQPFSPAPSEQIKSLSAAHLSFHQHLLYYIAQVWADHLLFTRGSSSMRWLLLLVLYTSPPQTLYRSDSCRGTFPFSFFS